MRLYFVADFRKLRVWDAAQQLAVDADGVADAMRNARTRSLCDQLTRAAGSVVANIVEGSAHESPREFVRFLNYSRASDTELEGHIRLSRKMNIMAQSDFTRLLARIVSVRKMLNSLIKKVRARFPEGNG